VKASRHLLLVVALLRAQREHADAQLRELLVRVAEAARLRGASASAGDRVPPRRQLLIGAAGAWVTEQNGPAVELVEPDALPGGRPQRNRWNGGTEEMIGRAVVPRDRKVLGNGVDVVAAGHRV
jgi:hypothetical protein